MRQDVLTAIRIACPGGIFNAFVPLSPLAGIHPEATERPSAPLFAQDTIFEKPERFPCRIIKNDL
jgi:hypothetical protein